MSRKKRKHPKVPKVRRVWGIDPRTKIKVSKKIYRRKRDVMTKQLEENPG